MMQLVKLEGVKEKFPKIQILTVKELLEGKRPALPSGASNVSLEARQAKSLRTSRAGEAMPGLFDSIE